MIDERLAVNFVRGIQHPTFKSQTKYIAGGGTFTKFSLFFMHLRFKKIKSFFSVPQTFRFLSQVSILGSYNILYRIRCVDWRTYLLRFRIHSNIFQSIWYPFPFNRQQSLFMTLRMNKIKPKKEWDIYVRNENEKKCVSPKV